MRCRAYMYTWGWCKAIKQREAFGMLMLWTLAVPSKSPPKDNKHSECVSLRGTFGSTLVHAFLSKPET